MKKGIVMKKHRRYMIVMTSRGIFQKAAPIEHSLIGDEVYFQPIHSKKWLAFFFYTKKNRRTSVGLLATVCMLLLIAMPFYFIMGKEETYAYVNIDINPSVELKVDHTLHVHDMTPLNEDADKIVRKISEYKHKDLEKVIAMIMNKSEEEGFINKGKSMLVGVSFKGKETEDIEMIARLKQHLTRDKSSWEIAAFHVPKQIREKAKEKNKTMNETMIKEIVEKDNMEKNTVNQDDKVIIETFYQE
ncbi:MAG TPA: anti-sigma factor domain-containing protein [Virgibacillus sp.]|nr:anti-sigma factor domain-containing protein [Virgibacillus sp.]